MIKKKVSKSDVPKIKEEVVEVKEEIKVDKPKKEYVLKKDVNQSLKAGMKVSEEKYNELVKNGLSGWF